MQGFSPRRPSLFKLKHTYTKHLGALALNHPLNSAVYIMLNYIYNIYYVKKKNAKPLTAICLLA